MFILWSLFLIGVKLLYNIVVLVYTMWWISYMYISPSSWTSLPTPIPPISVITEHQAELPVLYNCFPLATYFTYVSVYISVLISQLISPSPPHCVHMSILYVCISIALQIELIVAIFFFFRLHIYALVYSICFSHLTLLYMTDSRSIHISTNDPICSFNDWVIVYCVYVSHLLHSLICQWTFQLLPYPGYCKDCCNEHWGTCVFLNCSILWSFKKTTLILSFIKAASVYTVPTL